MFALRIGYTAIRNGLRDQLYGIKEEGLENIGKLNMLLANGRQYTLFNERNRDPLRYG